MFIAFLLSVGLAAICWWWLPRIGVGLPAWVPMAGYAIILCSALFTLARERSADDQPESEEPGEGPLRIDLDPDDNERML